MAQAFQSINYPILPDIDVQVAGRADCPGCTTEILHVRHHSLFAPRDFDVSAYFQIVKPALAADFKHRRLVWKKDTAVEAPWSLPALD